MNLIIVLGNQLFDYKHYRNIEGDIFMCEDISLCTHFKYHKHKIIHFLTSMRNYNDLLIERGRKTHYFKLNKEEQFFSKLKNTVKKYSKITIYEIEDKFFEKKLLNFMEENNIEIKLLKSPMFMCSRDSFKQYLNNNKPFMKTFYEQQRKKHQILVNDDLTPVGGKWSFDTDNRKKIPKKVNIEPFSPPPIDAPHLEEVKDLVRKHFKDHPGDIENFWIPVTRKDSVSWFKSYLKQRFKNFGTYQDAIDTRCDFLNHSIISPLINIGFITPDEVAKKVEKELNSENINSVEGFIRQVIGWREFVRGIYQNFDNKQQTTNFFNNNKRLTPHWYNGTTGIPPVDDAIKKSIRWGYIHHIERLMVVGNIMLLLEIHPQEVYKWFMEMFIDSSDWVMGPNVFGMSQFSDGGIFATKPYISGSNYILKMSHYKKDEWTDIWDGLYWSFINKHRDFFSKNYRMSMMVKNFDKMDPHKKDTITKAANQFRNKVTI